MEVWFPPRQVRTRCDNKDGNRRIGNKAARVLVPNALERVESYAHLRCRCRRARLGRTW